MPFALCTLAMFSCQEKNNANLTAVLEHHKDANGFSYETVTNDPTGLRLYTLDNGLKVYLSRNDDEPKIQTYIAVRAGSNYDPKETTGLAHYLEHMMFKGTDEIGTVNWEKEREYLQQISDVYEQYRAEKDSEKKKALYATIDKLSLEASNYSVANEYDKMIKALGATGTNAHTWFEETVYKNKIPANELDKWLHLESERFSQLVLRLFHTELETVFEEFNMGQDNDFRKSYAAMLDGLFPRHPYGQQTTIGVGEHLKNPSMVAIHRYFDTYYVPNNMALVLVGDLEFEATIQKVSSTFGKMERSDLTHPTLPREEAISSPITKEVLGPTAERISIAFRSGGVNTADEKLVTLADMILANGEAGLIDLNLNQKQVVQEASCNPQFLNDYGYHLFTGYPKEGQTLEEVRDLLLEQIDQLKEGAFEEWMMEAVVNDLELRQTEEYESSTALANAYVNAFIHRKDWIEEVTFLDELRQVSKQELVDFANQFYKDNYVVTYKRKGIDTSVVKVDKPEITPVNLNRDTHSVFMQAFNEKVSAPLQPKYVDYAAAIKETKLSNGIAVHFIENTQNDLFEMNIIFDMGSDNDKKLGLAVGYMDYLGTETYSAEELKQEFYKLGVNYYVHTGSERSYVGLSGLEENLSKGVKLLSHLWNKAVPNQEAYDKYVARIMKSRQNYKTHKETILRRGLVSYAKYGEHSRLRTIFNKGELNAMNPQELVDLVKDLKNYKQRIFYYGRGVDAAVDALNEHHKVADDLKEYPEATTYTELATGGQVYFVDYDMVQAQIMLLAKENLFDAKKIAASAVFNTYFGAGLSSIVFQEIRESKSLAYSAYAFYLQATDKDDPNYVMAYIATQANKIPQAVDAMMDLMNDMPESEAQFKAAKEATLKKLAAQRITKSAIFWSYERLKKLGIDHDYREEVYAAIEKMTLSDLKAFFDETIRGKKYSAVVIGNKKTIDMKALSKLGKVQEMDIDYLFNYEKAGD